MDTTQLNDQAPGEAEAELAALSAAGLINAVVTNDVDTFLFGGLMVMRTYVIHSINSLPCAYPESCQVEHQKRQWLGHKIQHY